MPESTDVCLRVVFGGGGGGVLLGSGGGRCWKTDRQKAEAALVMRSAWGPAAESGRPRKVTLHPWGAERAALSVGPGAGQLVGTGLSGISNQLLFAKRISRLSAPT